MAPEWCVRTLVIPIHTNSVQDTEVALQPPHLRSSVSAVSASNQCGDEMP